MHSFTFGAGKDVGVMEGKCCVLVDATFMAISWAIASTSSREVQFADDLAFREPRISDAGSSDLERVAQPFSERDQRISLDFYPVTNCPAVNVMSC